MWRIKDRIKDEVFVKVCLEAKSMAEASVKLGLHFNSFKKRAIELGCYKTNQSGKGVTKRGKGYLLVDILNGKHPQYSTFKLKNRLLKEGLKINKCDVCGIEDWNSLDLRMELDHIDGNRTNHRFKNLRMLCPNCHSQTDTYRSKNVRVVELVDTLGLSPSSR